MKTNSWTTTGQAKDISSSTNTLVKVLWRGRHWVWGSNRRRAIKECSIAIKMIGLTTLKLNLRPNIGLTYAVSIVKLGPTNTNVEDVLSPRVKWILGIFVYEFFLYLFLLNLNYWCFTTILWKFQKNWMSWTCWKSVSKFPTQHISA